jgi:2-keto-4-pentenoate hydratase
MGVPIAVPDRRPPEPATMSDTTLTALADALLLARATGRRADPSPFAHALTEPADAYRVQDHIARTLDWFPDATAPRTWKTGAASLDGPASHAALPRCDVHNGHAELQLPPGSYAGVEAELAFRLRDDTHADDTAGLTPEQVLALFTDIAVAIEVVGSRWAGTAPPLLGLADQLSSRALVLGNWVPRFAVPWGAQPCSVRVGSRPALEVVGSHPLKDPSLLLQRWIQHAARAHGGRLPAGSIVTTGSWVGVVPVMAGQTVEVEFAGIGNAALHLAEPGAPACMAD